jgi:hypothetical protein
MTHAQSVERATGQRSRSRERGNRGKGTKRTHGRRRRRKCAREEEEEGNDELVHQCESVCGNADEGWEAERGVREDPLRAAAEKHQGDWDSVGDVEECDCEGEDRVEEVGVSLQNRLRELDAEIQKEGKARRTM